MLIDRTHPPVAVLTVILSIKTLSSRFSNIILQDISAELLSQVSTFFYCSHSHIERERNAVN